MSQNPNPKSERERLIDLLDLFSVKKGEEFTLASGQKSDVYVDVKKTVHDEVRTPRYVYDERRDGLAR